MSQISSTSDGLSSDDSCWCLCHVQKDENFLCATEEGACSPCQKIKDLDLEILKVKTSLESLTAQRAQLLIEVNQAHDPFIHRLPVELATRIFNFSLSPISMKQSPIRDLNYDRPQQLALGAVCRFWRQLAWSTPLIWTSLSLNLFETENERNLQRGELAKAWLKRAGSLPLFIRVHYHLQTSPEMDSSDFAEDREYNADAALDFLKPVIHRVQDLCLFLPKFLISAIEPRVRLVETTGKSALLEKLVIRVLDPDGFSTDRHFDLGPGFAPKELNIRGIRVKDVRIPWLQLRSFTGGSMPLCEVHDALMEGANLDACAFMSIKGQVRPGRLERLTHSKIRRLVMTDASRQATPFWHLFLLPSLTNLKVTVDSQSIGPFEQFIRDSKCSITSLELCGLKKATKRVTAENLVGLFRELRSLESLAFTECQVDAFMFEQLAWRTADRVQGVLPALVSFCYNGGAIVDPKTWEAIFNAFCSIDSPARTVKFCFDKAGEKVTSALRNVTGVDQIAATGVLFEIRDKAGHDLIESCRSSST